MNKSGFTLIELIMVIVILGVLAAIALPKFYNLTQQAELAAEAGVFGGVKAALAVYYANALANGSDELYPGSLEDTGVTPGSPDADNFFYGTGDGILRDPVKASEGWSENPANVYKGPEGTATYTYYPGTGKFTKS